MKDFVDEVIILRNTGILYNDTCIGFSLKSIVCDAPAISFLKCIIGHTGYYSCERCIVKGSWNNRVVFIDKEPYPPRTVQEFNNKLYLKHQSSITPLLKISNLNCVSNFPLDYMHLVCLGIVKRMITFLKQGPRVCRLSNAMLQEVSNILNSLNGKMPSNFSRQPRPLDEVERWKATEFKQFMLYSGPLALKCVVEKDVYEHFLTLHVSLSILLNSCNEYRTFYLDYAPQLINYFVMNAPTFYGNTFNVYNVHSLLHVHEDVRNFGCSLNEISAFRYENFMKTLKKMVRNANNPVVQIAKRLSEIKNTTRIKSSKKRVISIRLRDSCFLLKNEKFCLHKEKLSENCYRCHAFKLKQMENLYVKPIESKSLSIGVIKNMKSISFEECEVTVNDLARKVCMLPWKSGYAFFPLLHDIEKMM